jgi:protein SCO1/2
MFNIVPKQCLPPLFEPPQPALDFTLITDQGEINLADYRGKLVLLYFGYTFCPDACPTTLSKVSRALKRLSPEQASQVQLIFISVDPERDTPEVLGGYARNYAPTFIGGTQSLEDIANLAKAYGIFYQKNQVKSAAKYLVDHTTSITVIDRSGQRVLIWPYDAEINDLVKDLKVLLK